ncbi:MAG: hypothetical protein ACJAV5_001336 [Vicingaceae bacterium]|jgi:hypothetical protein
MNIIICQLLILFSLFCYGQTDYNFEKSDFYVNSLWDSLWFPAADSVSNNSKFYFSDNKTHVQEIRLLSNDTFLTYFMVEGVT